MISHAADRGASRSCTHGGTTSRCRGDTDENACTHQSKTNKSRSADGAKARESLSNLLSGAAPKRAFTTRSARAKADCVATPERLRCSKRRPRMRGRHSAAAAPAARSPRGRRRTPKIGWGCAPSTPRRLRDRRCAPSSRRKAAATCCAQAGGHADCDASAFAHVFSECIAV